MGRMDANEVLSNRRNLTFCLVSAAANAQRAQTEANKAPVIGFYNALAEGDIATLQALGRPVTSSTTLPSRPDWRA
jgi:hypothetical protein